MNTVIEFYIWGLWCLLVLALVFGVPYYIRKRTEQTRKMIYGSQPYEPFESDTDPDDQIHIEKNDSGRLI